MSVILYRGNDEEVRIEPHYLHQYLEAGWLLERVPAEAESVTEPHHENEVARGIQVEEEVPVSAEPEPGVQPSDDTQPEPEISLQDLRAQATAAGIENADKKHAKTLMRELADLANENEG